MGEGDRRLAETACCSNTTGGNNRIFWCLLVLMTTISGARMGQLLTEIEGGPMEMFGVTGCEKAATRVVNGHEFCAAHGEGDLHPEIPIVGCKVCGTAVPRPGLTFCADHAGWAGRNSVPPRAA
jgi:hypothetical protein